MAFPDGSDYYRDSMVAHNDWSECVWWFWWEVVGWPSHLLEKPWLFSKELKKCVREDGGKPSLRRIACLFSRPLALIVYLLLILDLLLKLVWFQKTIFIFCRFRLFVSRATLLPTLLRHRLSYLVMRIRPSPLAWVINEYSCLLSKKKKKKK